jgi:hypothetical protein
MSPAPAAIRRTRARRHRAPSAPLERDADLPLLRLERAITLQLAEAEAREHCAQLSEYLDGLSSERVLEMARI